MDPGAPKDRVRPPQRPPACRACKKRKSKCDFASPCSTCILHSTTDTCEYDRIAVPRERKPATKPAHRVSRPADTKALRARLEEAEAIIATQRARLQAMELAHHAAASRRASNSMGSNSGDTECSEHASPSASEEEASYREIAGLGELLQRLVIDRATASNSTSSQPNVADSVTSLLLSTGTASHFLHSIAPAGISLDGLERSPTHLESLIPDRPTITTVEGLVALFPSRDVAIDLCQQYLSHINLVHHVVDGPLALSELASFYDLRTPTFMEPGWLSGQLAIFALAKASSIGKRFNVQAGDFQRQELVQTLAWIDGALQALGMRMTTIEDQLDLTAVRSVCLVVWLFVLFGSDSKMKPAISLNATMLHRACERLHLHRDPLILNPTMPVREVEDRRRLFWNLLNTSWLFCSVTGQTYSPVGVDSHDVELPTYLEVRAESKEAISALAFRSLLMRQLRRLTVHSMSRGMSESEARRFESELDRLDLGMPTWCLLDVDDFRNPPNDDPGPQAEFQQLILTNVQSCAVRLRFHGHLAYSVPTAPAWKQEAAGRHRSIAVSNCIRLLKLQRLQLTYATRVLGHSGYPRYHSACAALALSAFMMNATNMVEQSLLFSQLSQHIKFLRSCGALSDITSHTVDAVETTLIQIQSQQGMPAPFGSPTSPNGPNPPMSASTNSSSMSGHGSNMSGHGPTGSGHNIPGLVDLSSNGNFNGPSHIPAPLLAGAQPFNTVVANTQMSDFGDTSSPSPYQTLFQFGSPDYSDPSPNNGPWLDWLVNPEGQPVGEHHQQPIRSQW